MTNLICSHEFCTGCGECLTVCPQHCITLQPNPQGHLYPRIDTQKCVNCNLCRQKCPANTPVVLHEPQACWAAWAKEEKERTTSSSGAAASLFAKYIIAKGGVVYGAALEKGEIRHIRVHQEHDLGRLKGSKYVYSYAADVYAPLRQDLMDGKTVLFVGTPCQNAGVSNYVGDHPNLFLVNLICHGTPSFQMLKDHLKERGVTQIDTIQFRNNNNNNAYDFRCNDYRALSRLLPDEYVTCFLMGYTYRPACYNCAYAKPQRAGDVTLGDFWGLGKQTPFEGGDTSKGCSVILINTPKGKQLLEACRDKMHLFPRAYQEAQAGNPQLCGPVPCRVIADKFSTYYPRYSFAGAAWRTVPRLLATRALKDILKRRTPALRIKRALQKWLAR